MVDKDTIDRARERVRDDGVLVADVASIVSVSLGLTKPNRTLGRNVVIAALDAHIAATGSQGGGLDSFRAATRAYGAVGDDVLSDVFGKVTIRFRGATVQLQAMKAEEGREGAGQEAADGNEADGEMSGFGKVERLGPARAGPMLKGGLVKKHTFQPPAQRVTQGSLLGLDKLAAQKRGEKEALAG
ncbi:unnamed protein product, partial [Choristocarpus tenellus]